MSINADIRDHAYQFFIEEAPELLQLIEEGLLTLKHEKTTPKVHEIMRAAHSIKGGSASVGLEEIKEISHRLEDIFKALYSDEIIIDSELDNLLFQGYDALKNPLMEQIQTGYHDGKLALEKAEIIFQQIEDLLGDALHQAEEFIPTSADLGIDIVASLFEVDVAQGLENLQTILSNPDQYNIIEELKNQAEIFAGFSELLNLPGFGELSQTIITAIDYNPDKALDIGKIAYEDLNQAREDVLAGDRTTGGKPSDKLLAFTHSLNSTFDDNFTTDNLTDFTIAETSDNNKEITTINFDDLIIEDDLDPPVFTFRESDSTFDFEGDLDFSIPEDEINLSVEDVFSLPETDITVTDNDFIIPESDFSIPEDEINLSVEDVFSLPETDITVTDNDFIIPESDFSISEDEINLSVEDVFSLPETDITITDNDFIIPESDFSISEDEINLSVEDVFSLPETDITVTDNDFIIPENDFSISEDEINLSVEDVFSLPETDITVTDNDFIIPENDFSISEDEINLSVEDVFSLPETDITVTDNDFIIPESDLNLTEDDYTLSDEDVFTIIDDELDNDDDINLNQNTENQSTSESLLSNDIHDHAYQFFVEEVPELLHIIEEGILNLRNDKSPAKVHEIMRAAHSIKGGSATVGLNAIKEIAHRLEDIFKALYNDSVIVDRRLENLLLRGYDRLRWPLTDQIEKGYHNAEKALKDAESILKDIEEVLGDAMNHIDDFMPSSEDLGIDMVATIFDVDVLEGINRLKTVVADPQNYEIAGELRAQCEVFAGFSELLNLPGFGDIANTAMQALDMNPDRILDILNLAINNFTQARDNVLGGDRQLGGIPLPELIEFTQTQTVSSNWDQALDQELENIPIVINNDTDWDKTIENELGSISVDRIDLENTILEPITLENIPNVEYLFPSIPSTETLIQPATISPKITEEITSDSPIDSEKLTPQEIVKLSQETFIPTDNSVIELNHTIITSEIQELILSPENNQPDLLIPPSEVAPREENINPETPPIMAEITLTQETPLTAETPVEESLKIPDTPRSLEDEIHSVEKLFTQLPLAENITPSAPTSTKKGTRNKAVTPKTTQQTSAGNLSVRVDLNRLERMNDLVGELVINRNGLSLQNDQLQGKVRELQSRFIRFQSIARQLLQMSDQMIISGERLNYRPNSTENSEFDSLEMDSYGKMHTVLTEVLEEMVQLEEAVDDITLYARQSNQTIDYQRQMLTHLRDELMWARMLPLGEVLKRFPRVIRDLSNKYEKEVELKLTGTGVLVDKAVLEKLYDPLLHLLRNGFDHGIERPEVRQKKGKNPQGSIEIRAYHQGNETIIEMRDDGQGINLNRVAQKAVEKGLISADQVSTYPKSALMDFIFQPAFSTADRVSELSGRGVGLDVVRSQIRALKGSVTVTSTPGEGTTFSLRLPLTLTIAKLLVCVVGSTAIAFPSDSIEEIVIPHPNQIKHSGSQLFVHWREQLVPAYRSINMLQYNCPLPESLPSKALTAVPSPEDWALPLLVIRRENKVFALEVDRLVTEQELVIKPYGSAIASPPFSYGCTILGDGSLIPVIDAATLLEQHSGQGTQSARQIDIFQKKSSISQGIATPQKLETATILVVDDSAALRRTLAFTLQKSGYRVLQARDGKEALEQLQQSSQIQLVICDVEMPNMNGFEFLGQRRKDANMMKVPVAMLTSRSNDKHRRLAMQLGANEYFTKPYVEQEFLKSVQSLITQVSPQLIS